MKRFIFCTLLLYFYIGQTYSQQYWFNHITTNDGLSHISANDIYQDEIGRMWFATRAGLNCYDGNKIKTYRSNTQKDKQLNISLINNITGDKNGHLYLRTHQSFIKFDMQTETFTTIIKNNVSAIYQGKNQTWLCVGDTIYQYHPGTSPTLTRTAILDNPHNQIYYNIFEDSDQNCWICTNKGLYLLDRNNNIHHYIPEYSIKHIFQDTQNYLWVSTLGKGLLKLNRSGQILKNYRKGQSAHTLISDSVRCVCEDNTGKIWVGSQFGLCRLDTAQHTFEHFHSNIDSPSALTSESITALYKDIQGTIWISTYFGGINYINFRSQPFTYYPPGKYGLDFPVITKFVEDKRGTIWIGTEGGGLYSYSPRTSRFKNYRKGLSRLNLKEIYYDSERDCLWIGFSENGLNRFDIKTGQITAYSAKMKNLKITSWENKLLIGASQRLGIFDPERPYNSIIAFPDKNKYGLEPSILSLLSDNQGNIWFGTYNGLYTYNPHLDKLSFYNYNRTDTSSLSGTIITSLYQDSKNRIWAVAMDRGLNLFHPVNKTFAHYSHSADGLLDNNITAITELPSGRLLLGTSAGLSILDPEKGQFTNYDYKRGFPLTMVNDGSLLVSQNQDIYVGGVTGLVIFKEKDLLQTPIKPSKIWFNNLYVNNIEVNTSDPDNILNKNISFTNNIKLKHDYNVFSIQIATDNYIKSNILNIQYRLIGYNDKWLTLNDHQMPTYTSLPPGDYTLETRIKEYPSICKSINISILPPLYKTWYAYLSYIILIAGFSYWFYRQIHTRLYLKQSLEFEKKEKLMAEKATQSKLRFFTNISHEFNTPLTLILGQTDSLLKSYNLSPTATHKVLNIYKNADNLKKLVEELIEFRKQEQGYMKLKISHTDISVFIEEISALFKEYAANKKIKFTTQCPDKEIKIWIDTRQMQKVFNNLLSNAFKFTPSNGEIKIVVSNTDSSVDIAISDTGTGIKPNELNHIFEPFYQCEETETQHKGTGIGLTFSKSIVDAHGGHISVNSQFGNGTTFTIKLKKGDAHFKTSVTRIQEENIQNLQESIQPDSTFSENIIELPTQKLGKMLIVEDNKELVQLLVETFTPFYDTDVACDGIEGLQKVRRNSPDIIISDIMMPRMSGIELCTTIKKNLDTCHIPVVLLTAKSAIEHKIEGLKIGADDYITKPFDINLLVIRCNNLINNRKIMQQRYREDPDFSIPQMATNPLDHELLNRATEIVRKNLFNEQFSVDTFATEIGLGRTTLFTKLKSITGLTPNNFIMDIRLKKAAEMLTTRTEMNISEIAYDLGFSTPKYFKKCFKDRFAYTPTEYRQKNQKTRSTQPYKDT